MRLTVARRNLTDADVAAKETDGDERARGLFEVMLNQTTAGLQRWVSDSTSGSWKRAYTITNRQLPRPSTATATKVPIPTTWSRSPTR